MTDNISYCGIDCGSCPVYQATRVNDAMAREKAAELFSKLFKTEIPASAINCDGCKSSTGIIFGHCKTCEVRDCATGRKLESCAYCSDYSCQKLDDQLAEIPLPQPRERLDALRKRT